MINIPLRIMFMVLWLCTLVCSNESQAVIIFEDSFDGHPDWSPPQQAIATSSTSDLASGIPTGYSDWRIGGTSNTVGEGHNTINIDSTQYRGDKGKALVFWVEMTHDWGSDGLLGVDIGPQKEIYIRYYIKFPNDWKWALGDTISPMQKFLHASHYDPNDPASLYDYFSATQNKPRYIHNWAKMSRGAADVCSNHLISWFDNGDSRKEQFYYPGGYYGGSGTDWTTNAEDYSAALSDAGGFDDYIPFDKGMMGDGEWHCIEWRLKMNSADGVADGILAFWQDGVLLEEYTDIVWANTESQQRLWNRVWLGGNAINRYDDGEGSEPWDRLNEQWYAIDDFVISTEYIGPDNCTVHDLRIRP